MAPLRPAPPSTDPPEAGPPADDGLADPLAAYRTGPPPGLRQRAVDGLVAWRDRRPLSPGRVVGAALAVVALLGGGWWLLRPAAPPVEASLPLASGTAPAAGEGLTSTVAGAGATAAGIGSTTSTVATELVVQAAGAVAQPGVYRLAGGARVDDLVRAAGGLVPEADGDRVNLAAPLTDGERIWVPVRGEAEVPDVVAGTGGGGGAAGGAASPDGDGAGTTPEVVDLNTADATALDTLPGVGPSTAQAILSYRTEHGPFTAVDDLLEVRGIGEAKLEQLRPLVRVG